MAIQLIVGLGNPGTKYENTRHNAGAWFLEELCRAANCKLRPESKFQGRLGMTAHFGQDCYLLIPSTYMNLSGGAVRAVASYYKIAPEDILIVHDEIDLPAGIARLKFDGGSGGHNGLVDIIEHLGTKSFARLRIGVGHPGTSKDVIDYVLKAPSKSDRQEIAAAMERAQEVLPLVVAGDLQKAMHQLHSA